MRITLCTTQDVFCFYIIDWFPAKIFHLDDIAAESFIKNVQSFFSLLHSSRCFQQQKRKLAEIIDGKAISLSCILTGPGAKMYRFSHQAELFSFLDSRKSGSKRTQPGLHTVPQKPVKCPDREAQAPGNTAIRYAAGSPGNFAVYKAASAWQRCS